MRDEQIERGLKEIEEILSEIEAKQDIVEHIIYNKNPIYKFFKYNKALRLHEETSEKIVELYKKMEKVSELIDAYNEKYSYIKKENICQI